MNDLEQARQQLAQGQYSCVLCCGQRMICENGRSVAPLLKLIGQKTDLRGFSAADKIVGKAAALLLVSAGIKAVYAPLMSTAGIRVLQAHGIPAEYDREVPMILNQDETDMCPMEKSVQTVEAPERAYQVLNETLQQLRSKAAGEKK